MISGDQAGPIEGLLPLGLAIFGGIITSRSAIKGAR